MNLRELRPQATAPAPNFVNVRPQATAPAPNFGGKRRALFQVLYIKTSNLGCKSCKMYNSWTFSPELGSASQRRGRNSRNIHKLGFSKFA